MRASRLLLSLTLVAISCIVGCSDDGGASDAEPDLQTADIIDVDEDLTPDDTVTPDVIDTQDDAEEDAEEDVADVEEDAGLCPGSVLCLDPVSGNPSVRVCREAGLPDGTTCERMDGVACCVEPFRCESDLDCGIAQGEGTEDFCLDPRFPCVCDIESGSCGTFVCSADQDCDASETCVGGRCIAMETQELIGARFLTPDLFVRPGTDVRLEAVAVMLENPSQSVLEAELAFTVDSGDATFDAATQTLRIGADAVESGFVSVRAVANPGDTGDTLRYHYTSGTTSGLSVRIIDEYTRLEVGGATLVVNGVEYTSSVDGRVRIDESGPHDVHVFANGYAYVSVIDVADDTLVVPLPRDVRASIAAPAPTCSAADEDFTATLQSENCGGVGEPECLCFQLENVDIVVGIPTFDNVAGPGDTQVTISGFSLGNSLLDLNFDVILGPAIDRVLGPPISQDAEVPSGVTLSFNGDALINSFIATAPVGERMMWSIGGRVALSDILRDVIGSIGGDLNIGAILATILPFFDNFYSDIAGPIQLSEDGTFPARDPGLALDIPTQRTILVEVPELPELEAGWADTMVVLGGVLVPGEGFLPLGITAGSDSLELSNADGRVDGDLDTPELDPLRMAMAPMHGPARTPGSRYMFAAVALVLNENADAPREASAGIIRVLDPGASLPEVVSFDTGFPPFALGSIWDTETRTLTIAQQTDVPDMHRVVFRDPADHLWIAFAPDGQRVVTLPVPPDGFDDRATAARVNVVGVNTIESSLTELTNGGPRSLGDLFEVIESFGIIGL